MKIEIGMKGWFTAGTGVVTQRQRAEVVRVWSESCVNLRCDDGSEPTSVLIKQPGCVGYYFEPDVADAIEQEIQAKGLTAPRVTPGDIEAEIVTTEFVVHVAPSGQVLRWAVLTTRCGYAVTGRPSVSVSPENDDAELGEKIARENAVNQLWPLMGYALKTRLAGPTEEMVGRFLAWPVPASVYPDGTPGQPGRTGTNLLSAVEARQMLEHVLRKG
ncbi:MAG TPA: Gp49 family protein [Roseateles sp.]